MIERIKAMPFSVLVSIMFLLISYIVWCFTVPQIGLLLTFIVACFAAAYRIINYIVDGC